MDAASMISGFKIDGWSLLASFIFGVIGMWMFKESRRRENKITLIIGILLMVYPYVVDGRLLTWAVGIALCGAAKYYWWR